MPGFAALLLALAAPAAAQDAPPLLKPAEAAAIASEVSGSAAKRTVQALSLHHRMRGSEGYRANVRTLVKRIRQKFCDVDDQFAAIVSVPGFGYRWREGAPDGQA